ncbi:PcMYB1 protein [Artemisia annua]|uniref:PcMYB1 protein n=1 Tax=Artemisia annua TaxID=35608 RepID=A0A2U1MX30_ARTAN|nr:PcMYB1 protein [Artemisia annua]
MTKHKERWTKEQVEALWASVKKYGVGKWQVILSDPQFGSALSNRSNIDLKQVVTNPADRETLEDVAMAVARQISIAENMEQETIKACEETDKISELLDESSVMTN